MIYSIFRRIYYWLPFPQYIKWRIREYLYILFSALRGGCSFSAFLSAVLSRHGRGGGNYEVILVQILQVMEKYAGIYGPLRHWIAVSFLDNRDEIGFAIDLCKALRKIGAGQQVLLLETDGNSTERKIMLPDGVILISLNDFYHDLNCFCKQRILFDILTAVQPRVFHNINSEIAWQTILTKGSVIQEYTRCFANVFSFEYYSNEKTYTNYVRRGMPFLSGLLLDNSSVLKRITSEYQLTSEEQSRIAVLETGGLLYKEAGKKYLERWLYVIKEGGNQVSKKLQVLCFGLLNDEKQIDFFLEVIKHCAFADFIFYGEIDKSYYRNFSAYPNFIHERKFFSLSEYERFNFGICWFLSSQDVAQSILHEVAALGIPVLAQTKGEMSEIINNSTGYPISEEATVDDFKRVLQVIFEDPAEAIARASKLYQLVKQKYFLEYFINFFSNWPNYVKQLPRDTNASIYHTHVPLVSVIIPCYNQGQYLLDSVTSALSSCTHPMEIIVIDDGSTDNAISSQLAEVEKIAPDIVRIFRQRNMGLSGARNSGIMLAQGQYIQFLDADDVLAPGKIDIQLAQFHVNPDLDVSVCDFLLCDSKQVAFGKPQETISQFTFSEQDFLYSWERGFSIPIHCGLFRYEVVKETFFPVDLAAKEDWVFWTSLSIKKVRFAYIHGNFAIYRQHENSMRRSYVKMGHCWLKAAVKIHNMLNKKQPLFLEAALSWFIQYYYKSPMYQKEIKAMKIAVDEKEV